MLSERVDLDRRTLAPIAGWPCVLQDAEMIFTTGYFSRVMRPHVGSNAPRLLGQLANAGNIQRFRWAVSLALLLFVPNFKPTRVQILDLDRTGAAGWTVDGIYYPFGHLGDFSQGALKSLALDGGAGTVTDLMS